MSSSGSRRPLLPGRGCLAAPEFCQATGLHEAIVADMVRDGILDGLLDQHGQLFGLFDDTLPSVEELKARGHVVNGAYDPEQFRSHVVEDYPDEPDDQGEGSSTWSMRWP
jgi:hypothetical protein